MKSLSQSVRVLSGLGILLISIALTGCGGGGSQKPILGLNTGNVLQPQAGLNVPSVISVAPAINASGVPTNSAIVVAAFNIPVAATLSGSNFTLTCTAPCSSPTGTVALDST